MPIICSIHGEHGAGDILINIEPSALKLLCPMNFKTYAVTNLSLWTPPCKYKSRMWLKIWICSVTIKQCGFVQRTVYFLNNLADWILIPLFMVQQLMCSIKYWMTYAFMLHFIKKNMHSLKVTRKNTYLLKLSIIHLKEILEVPV